MVNRRTCFHYFLIMFTNKLFLVPTHNFFPDSKNFMFHFSWSQDLNMMSVLFQMGVMTWSRHSLSRSCVMCWQWRRWRSCVMCCRQRWWWWWHNEEVDNNDDDDKDDDSDGNDDMTTTMSMMTWWQRWQRQWRRWQWWMMKMWSGPRWDPNVTRRDVTWWSINSCEHVSHWLS